MRNAIVVVRVFALLVAFVTSAYAALPNCGRTAIFFGNGVWNDERDSIDSKDALREAIQNSGLFSSAELEKLDFGRAFNPSAGTWDDIWETFAQMQIANETEGWRKLLQIDAWTQEERDVIEGQIAKRILAERNLDQDTLRRHVRAYRQYIHDGGKVVVVAHSQGNFYANEAVDLVSNGAYDVGVDKLSDQERQAFAIIGVANPDNRIARPVLSPGYTTLYGDRIIDLVAKMGQEPLLANTNDPPPPALILDLSGHMFAETYLWPGSESENRIEIWTRVATAKDQLVNPNCPLDEPPIAVDFDYSPSAADTASITQVLGFDGIETGQAFPIGRTGQLTRVDVKILTTADPPTASSVYASVYAVPGPNLDVPTTAPLLTVVVPFSSLPSNTWQYVTSQGFGDVPWTSIMLPGNGLPVSAGQQYLVAFWTEPSTANYRPSIAGGTGPQVGSNLNRFERPYPDGTWQNIGSGYFLRTYVREP